MVWPDGAGVTSDIVVVNTKGWNRLVLITVDSSAKFPEWAAGDQAASRLVPGLGDMAFAGPEGGPDAKSVVFRKGPRAVRMISPDNPDHMSETQLIQLAKLIASRMP